MRLLEACSEGKFRLTDDLVRDIPRYAILSHTWGPDSEEVTFRDLIDGTSEVKAGYEKLRFCAAQARRDGLRYFWIDTCCIDKSNSSELSKAINSMFRWYRNSVRCYVYLPDISESTGEVETHQSEMLWESAFRASRWFTRGWTLQELLAPASVEFFTKEGLRLGDKKSLEQKIHQITGIAIPALQGSALAKFGVEERFGWAETRQTTQEEDWAYCLLGIFDVFMPPIYGEGKAHAVRRLRKEIAEAANRIDTLSHEDGAGKRVWMVPFERNLSFTSRESELQQLMQTLFTGNQTTKVAITGLGGIGKTQLALELVYRVRAEQKHRSVIWIPATSKESLEQAYANTARLLGISGCADEKEDAKRLVQNHFSSEEGGQWLLVFDNADNISMWVDKPGPESSRLIDYLPKGPGGSIIFTTRDKKTAVKLAGRNVVEISEVDEIDGKQLLRNYLVDQYLVDNHEQANNLLIQLAYLPLAIVQAAMYINENGIGIGDYLSLLQEQEEDVIDLLSEDFEDERRYHDLKNPVATTWLISFEEVRRRDPLAADYLSFMACIDAKDIPRSLLPPAPSLKTETDAIGTLRAYSFITVRPVDSAITIHRLVHLATKGWLRKTGLLSSQTESTLERLFEVMGQPRHMNVAMWRPIMPHVYYALESSLNIEDSDLRLLLFEKYALGLRAAGRYSEAAASFERVIQRRAATRGEHDASTLRNISHLVMVFIDLCDYERADSLNMKILEACRMDPEVDDYQLLSAREYRAFLHVNLGRPEEAIREYWQVIEACKAKLGEDHSLTLAAMNSLVFALWDQGQNEEAEQLQVQVAMIDKRVYGMGNEALQSLMQLASIRYKQSDFEEATRLSKEVLEARRTMLGEEHPETVLPMNYLALSLKAQGLHEESLELMESCVRIGQQVLGPRHRYTLYSLNTLERWNAE